MAARLYLGGAIMFIWALQTAITVVSVGASAEFTAKAIRFWLN
jgi:hypothetical protein